MISDSGVSVERCRDGSRTSHPSGSRQSGHEGRRPLTHKASQKRIGRASACPIGTCTESVARRHLAGVQPVVAHALAAESYVAFFLAGAASNHSSWFYQPHSMADRTDQALMRIPSLRRTAAGRAGRVTSRGPACVRAPWSRRCCSSSLPSCWQRRWVTLSLFGQLATRWLESTQTAWNDVM